MWFPDEGFWGMRIDPRTPTSVSQLPEVCLVYPTLYEYATQAVHAATTGSGVFTSPDGTIVVRDAETEVNDPPFVSVIAAARTVSTIAGVLGIAAIAIAGTCLYGATTGVLAAFLLATSPFDILQTHVASVDALLAALGTCVLLCSWHLARRGTVVAALLAGIVVGLGFATKYTGLAFICPAAWAVIEASRSRARLRTLTRLGTALALGTIVGAVVGCPRCALQPGTVRDILLWHQSLAADPPFDGNRLADSVGWYARHWLYQLVAALPYVLGLPTYLLALVGIVRAAWRRGLGDRLVLALLLPYFLVIGAATATFPRHLLVLVPGLVLLAGAAMARLPSRGLRWTVIVITVGYSFALSATHVARIGWYQQDETARAIAARVTMSNGVAGARVAFPDYGPYFRLHQPFRQAGLAPEPREAGTWFTHPAPFFVVPAWYATVLRRDEREPVLLRDLDALETGRTDYRVLHRIAVPWYLQQPLDAWLDPALAVDLWQGAIGFTIYERQTPPLDPSHPAP
jgi:hypothetical protein